MATGPDAVVDADCHPTAKPVAISGAPTRMKHPSTTRTPCLMGNSPSSISNPTRLMAMTHSPTARLPSSTSFIQMMAEGNAEFGAGEAMLEFI